ncbi:hypothetical protein [Effusibacillus consociatus]|uniref:O-antigen translocase n=1 Tax=Effusibacillus consociatus TaxID=1117041 RepID=A0ABV9Q6V0_9BACL
MSNLLKAFLKTGGGSVAAILFGVIATKVIAVVSGPAGVGLFSLLRQTQQTLVGLATMQGNTALVQGLSTREDSSQTRYIVTVASLFVLMTGTISLIVWFAAPRLANLILDRADVQSVWLIRGLIPSILFAAAVIFLGGLLNSYRALGRLALVQVFSSAVAAITAFPLVVLVGNPWGLLLLLWVTSFTGLMAGFGFVWRGGWLSPLFANWRRLWDRDAALYFLKFAGVTILTGLIGTGTLLLVRAMFVRHGGLTGAGIFDVAWTLNSTYLMILLGSLGTYYMPVLSATKDIEGRSALIAQVFRIMLILVVPLITVMILGKSAVISLLYTKEFFPALEIIQWMLLGDYLKAIAWVLATPMLAYGDMRMFFKTEFLWNMGMAIGAWLALFVFGQIWIVGIVFVVLYVIYLAFCYWYSKTRHGLRLTIREKSTWIFGLILIIIASALSWNEQSIDWMKVVLFTCILGGFVLSGTAKSERNSLVHYLKRRQRF